MKPFDLVVIGGGSAGFAAAQTAGRLGARVAVVDSAQKLGGLCILRGCMPTKTLLESSHRLYEINRSAEFGLRGKPFRPNYSAIFKRKEKAQSGLFSMALDEQSFLNIKFFTALMLVWQRTHP